jgi:hypothetical protein
MGTCEVWLDKKRVFYNDNCDNCAAAFPENPAKIPIDFSSCKEKCALRFFWLALHEPMWQVYRNSKLCANSWS